MNPKGTPGGRGHAARAKDFKGTIRRLMRYIAAYHRHLLLILILALLSTSFSIASPKLIGLVVTELFAGAAAKLGGAAESGIAFGYIYRIFGIMAVLYVFSAAFAYVQQWLTASVVQRTVFDLRQDVNHKLAKLPLKFYDGRPNGEILSRAVGDIENIGNSLQQSLSQLITSLITIVGGIVMMLTISPLMTLIVLITVPLSFYAVKQITTRSQPHFFGQMKQLGQLNAHVEEMYSGQRLVKAFGKEQESIAKFRAMNESLYDSGRKAQFISGIMIPVLALINNFGFVAICVGGALLVMRGAISVGDVQAVIQYAKQLSQPITQSASIINMFQSAIASAERVFEILDEEEERQDQPSPVHVGGLKGEVRFNDVRFGYKHDEPLMAGLSIHAKQGETVAIVGPTGAGKTTLINLLLRFYEIQGGAITIDGIDTASLPRPELRSLFGMVLQDTWLFKGTIRDNIAYGKPGVSEADIVRAAQAAYADRFIRALPDGYDTVINEEASNLSQGQKQLLTIARALLADPVILLLDEATSSVDTRTEIQIQKAMKRLMQGRTSFIIAHRLSTIREADLILVMQQGDVVEQGTHEALLERGGVYAELYNSQFEQGEEEAATAY